MPKKRKRRKYPARQFFIYINPDGSQYLPLGYEQFIEIPEPELPSDIDEFIFSIRPLPAGFAIAASDRMVTTMMKSQLAIQSNNASQADLEISNATLAQTHDLVAAITEWNEADEAGNPIPITADTLAQLEPGWLYSCIREAYDSLNTLGKKNTGQNQSLHRKSNTATVPTIRPDSDPAIS